MLLNQLLNLDVSKNPALIAINGSTNNFFILNLKNGFNTNFTGLGNFKNNP